MPVILLVAVQLMNAPPLKAQTPVCDGTTMYAIFNDSVGSINPPNKPSLIYAVPFATGARTTLMGGTGFTFAKKLTNPSNGVQTTYYGSASLGLDNVAKRFYTNTQMPTNYGGAKDFYAVNSSTASSNVIATTPSVSTANVPTTLADGLDQYHFVKMAVNPLGSYIYALGVIRDTTLSTPATSNPLIRMNACGGAGCANAGMLLLGYLPPLPSMMANWQVFNGDFAFSSTGDLYFATVAYAYVNGSGRYTDARLFKIAAASIPTVAGTGTVPMTFVADYNTLDSTAMDGIAFDLTGAMYMTTRKFNGVQNLSTTTFSSQLYKSTAPGIATLVPAFNAPAGYAIADLASCVFPLTLLASNELDLTGQYSGGYVNLRWTVNNNTNTRYYELQRSSDGENFTTIAQVDPVNTNLAEQTYTYKDPQSGYGSTLYYRVREVSNNSTIRMYSQVLRVVFNTKINMVSRPAPNPFSDYINVSVQLRSPAAISARLIDQSGRTVRQFALAGSEGVNKLTINGVLGLSS
ncbi:MAG TPA: hypothetical protein VLD19_16515, partial [Chitinophagaceae bacterium]|nr:hypothetical protein [Chitinophagaceae bacterium]